MYCTVYSIVYVYTFGVWVQRRTPAPFVFYNQKQSFPWMAMCTVRIPSTSTQCAIRFCSAKLFSAKISSSSACTRTSHTFGHGHETNRSADNGEAHIYIYYVSEATVDAAADCWDGKQMEPELSLIFCDCSAMLIIIFGVCIVPIAFA